MTGVENYNNDFDSKAKNRIAKNPDKNYLSSFYYYLLSDMSYSSAYGYLGNVIGFVNKFNIKDPKTITLDYYTKYMATIKNRTSSYKIMVYSALEKFSKFLKANQITEDYMQYISRPKFKESQKTREKREIGFMTDDEIKKFLNNIKASDKKEIWKIRDFAMATVLLNSGIRCSALQKLDIEDINFSSNTITVLEKGDASRKIYLSKSTMDILKKWVGCRKYLVNENENAVFISDRNRRMDRKTIYNIIKSYGLNIEGKNITPHKTRATYGTQLYDKTHDLYFVQECMGHSNPKTTETYIRGQKGKASKTAADIMEKLI